MITVDKATFSAQLDVCENLSASFTRIGKGGTKYVIPRLHSLRPLFAYVELKIENGRIKLSAMKDTSCGYFYYNPKEIVDEEEGTRIIVQTVEINKLIASRYDGDISLEVQDDVLVIKQGSFVAKLPLYRQEVFPDFNWTLEWKKLPLEFVDVAKSCISVSDGTSVLVDVEDKGSVVFTYSPIQMYFSGVKGMTGGFGRNVVSMDCLKVVYTCFQGEESMEYGIHDDAIYFKSKDKCVCFKLLYDDMPMNYKEALSLDGMRHIKVDREAFLFVLESVSQVLAKWDELVLLTVSSEKKVMNIKTTNLMTNSSAHESVKVETDLNVDFQIGVPASGMSQYLKNMTDSKIELRVSQSDRPVIVSGEGGSFYVAFMPFAV